MSLLYIDKIRLNIGDSVVPYDIPDDAIDDVYAEYPSATYSEALRIWNTTIQCLIWLKAMYAKTALRQRESVGGVSVEEYGGERYKAICELLDYYKATPPNSADGASVIAGFMFPSGAPRIKIDWRDECLPNYDPTSI